MGANIQKEDQGVSLEGRNLPLLVDDSNRKYKLLAMVGGGAFGRVYRVQEVLTKSIYALKVVPYSANKKGLNMKHLKLVIESAETERKLLSRINHENVVRLYTSFIIDRSPIEPQSEKNEHLCILIEYVKGSDLNELLSKCEEQNMNKEEVIPTELVIQWFIKLIETLKYVHKQNIIHRDLKPDNILISYDDIHLDKKSGVNFKISDFGVGKDISKGELGKKISGQLFYTAPEVLQQKDEGYDSRCDIWSLGIIFLQVYAKISIKTYQKAVHDIFKRIKRTPVLNRRFCSRYGLDNMDSVTLLPLLVFMHENDLFYVLIEKFVKDQAVQRVLNNMICPYDQRLFSKELLGLAVIRTWMFVLKIVKEIKKEDFEILAVLTFLKIPDQIVFSRCVEILQDNIMLGVNSFVDNKGIRILFERISKMKELFKKKFLKIAVKIILKIIQHYKYRDEKRYKDCIRNVCVYFREFQCIASFKRMLLAQNSIPMYYFTFLLCISNQSIRYHLMDLVKSFLVKINDENRKYLLALIRTIVPHLPLNDLKDIFLFYKENDVTFLKKIKYINELAYEIIPRIWNHIETSKSEKEKESSLLFLAFCLQDYNKLQRKRYASDLKLHFNRFPSPKCRIKLVSQNVQEGDVIIHSQISKRLFSCNYNDKKKFVELQSSESIAVFNRLASNDEEEIAIGYYELFIKNGGENDDVMIGLYTRCREILLHCESGTIGVYDAATKQVNQCKYKSILCYTDYYVGVGITNKGNAFFTYNKTLITPFICFFTPDSTLNQKIYSLIKLNGNRFFKGHVNFGKRKFCFNFKDIIPKIGTKSKIDSSVNVNVVKEILKIDKEFKLLKYERKKSEKESFIWVLTSKLLYILGEPIECEDIDEDLIELFNEDDYEKTQKDFESSGLLIDDSKKKVTVKESILKKYQQIKERIKEKSIMGEHLMAAENERMGRTRCSSFTQDDLTKEDGEQILTPRNLQRIRSRSVRKQGFFKLNSKSEESAEDLISDLNERFGNMAPNSLGSNKRPSSVTVSNNNSVTKPNMLKKIGRAASSRILNYQPNSPKRTDQIKKQEKRKRRGSISRFFKSSKPEKGEFMGFGPNKIFKQDDDTGGDADFYEDQLFLE